MHIPLNKQLFKPHLTILFLNLMLCFMVVTDSAFAQAGKAFSLEINGIIKDDDNGRSIDGATVKVTTLNGTTVHSAVTTGSGKFKFVLDPQKEYLISANKPGYTGKIISINTKEVDVNSSTLDYYKFPISISIFKEIPGLDVSVLNSPIGAIFYNPTVKDFDYTADKFLRDAMEKMLKEMEKKKKEEEERKKREEEEARNKLKNDAKAQAEAEAAARKKAEEDAKDKIKNDAKARLDAEAEALAAKKRAEEDAKNKLKGDAKAKADAEAEAAAKRKAEDDAQKKAILDAKKAAEDEAAQKAKESAEATAAAKKAAEEDAKAKALADAEAEQKRREEAKQKAEANAASKAEARANEMAIRKAEADAKRLAAEEAKKIYVKLIEYDTEEGTNYIITKTTITKTNDERIVYKKITYNWGGLYFKKDEADITQDSFITDLKNVVVKTN